MLYIIKGGTHSNSFNDADIWKSSLLFSKQITLFEYLDKLTRRERNGKNGICNISFSLNNLYHNVSTKEYIYKAEDEKKR